MVDVRELITSAAIAAVASAVAVYGYHWYERKTAKHEYAAGYAVVTYYEVKDKGIQKPVVYPIGTLDGCLYVADKMDNLDSMIDSYCVILGKGTRNDG